MEHKMTLRRSQRIRNHAPITSEEDNEEDDVAEDRVVRTGEMNVDEDEAESGSAIVESNFNSHQKTTGPTRNYEPGKSSLEHQVVTEVSTLSVGVPSDRHPLYDLPQGYKRAVSFCVCLIISIIILQKPLYLGCSKEYPSSDCSDALHKLYKTYPQLETFWKNINVTYRICSKTERPGVILVLHNGNGDVANCIVDRTASLLSRLIGVHPAGEFLSVDGRTAVEEYGRNEFLSRIMDKRQSFGVVVFSHLAQLDSGLVKDLHFICDKDPNILDKAIIILVLKVETQTFKNKNLDEMAKRRIYDLWGSTLQERIQPIIGRITNIVGSIDENVVTECF